jgi:hypothetical protein
MADAIVGDEAKSRTTLFVEEKLRRGSSKVTHQIALRRGDSLGMWIGCGYPKSGTSWLCNLMGTALGLPFAKDSQLPVMMPAVLHGHWRYDRRLPPSLYIRRDGRDVVVSMYHFWVRGTRMTKNPKFRRTLTNFFLELYGPGFDPADVHGNLPRFIEYQMTAAPTTHGMTWQEHIADWWDCPRVGHLTYEELLTDTAGTLWRALAQASGSEPDREMTELAALRHDFARSSGRKRGEQHLGSFLRKGVAGDWRNQFTREAGEVFDSFAGDALVEFGYEQDRHWYETL